MKFNRGPKVALQVDHNGHFHLTLSDAFCCVGATQPLLYWLELYAQRIHSPWPIAFPGTPFQKAVFQNMQNIPFGQTVSYQQLAALAGKPTASRAVGNICNSNHFPLIVPCHRVIRSNGKMGGFATDIEIKRRLLEFEAG